ncbi:alkaline ceramidase-like [Impatiens glandulifera]|uniref:alkaline ceramidase-like n=1 Tax=Impatiens glandulifera TaxID=253017 RepID=UPI001FB04CB1|nr:alkaline ceramidase-like [Impatiens glandulifera]XP_047336799.1 alkaline ceramidase-like [Impatiens glandulifera]
MVDGMSTRFWGPVTSIIESCEKNYVYSPYIAEFFNTVSNIPCILLALIGLVNGLRQNFEKRFCVLEISTMIVAFGNILFHATLQRMQQQSDEIPMVWQLLLYIYILFSPDWHYRYTMPTFLFIYGCVFGMIHAWFHLGIGFKLHYIVLFLVCIPRMYKYYIYTEDGSAKGVAKLYAATLIIGSLCWVFDRVLCKEISGNWLSFNPQGHACWHFFIGFNSYFANTFLMFCRAQQRGWSPKIAHFFGILPYVKIKKKKKKPKTR